MAKSFTFEDWYAELPEPVQSQVDLHYAWLRSYHLPRIRQQKFPTTSTLTDQQRRIVEDAAVAQVEVASIGLLRYMVWATSDRDTRIALGWPLKDGDFCEQVLMLSRGAHRRWKADYAGLREHIKYAPLMGKDILTEAQPAVFRELNRRALNPDDPKQIEAMKEHNKVTGAYAPVETNVNVNDWREQLPEKVKRGDDS